MSSTRYSCQILMKLGFLDGFLKRNRMSNFKKIRSVETKPFHANGRADRHDEANSRFSQYCERA